MKNSDKKLKVEAIIFDIGDTLIDATLIAQKSLEATAEILRVKGLIHINQKFIDKYLEVDKTIQGPNVNHLFSDVSIIRKVLQAYGTDFSLQNIEFFLANYRDNVRRRIRKNKGMIDLFDNLKKSSFKLGVLTDGSTTEQTEQLHRLGILDKISSCITSEYLNIEKPNQLMFEKSLEELQISKPTDAVMVGNDLVRDIKGAKDFGMRTILVTKYIQFSTRVSNIKPDITVNSVYELPTCLEYKGK